jgi:hypothetical protein
MYDQGSIVRGQEYEFFTTEPTISEHNKKKLNQKGQNSDYLKKRDVALRDTCFHITTVCNLSGLRRLV